MPRSMPRSMPRTVLHTTCHAPTQLANALYMREGSMLLELGFASPLAAHYAHAAAALGLRYEACMHSDSRCTSGAYPVAS